MPNLGPSLLPLREVSFSSGNVVAQHFALPGPVMVTSERFGDNRGDFLETFSAHDVWELGIQNSFVQDNLSANPHSVVLRTAWACSPHDRKYAKAMTRLGREHAELSVVDDQHGAPSFAELIFDGAAKHGQSAPRLRAIRTSGHPTRARRHANSRLDCSRITEIPSAGPADWRDGPERGLAPQLAAKRNVS